MDENGYYALFGVEPAKAEPEGGKEPEVTAPAQETKETEMNDTSAANAEQGEAAAPTAEAAPKGEPGADAADAKPKGQTHEENARFAAARRKAEAERDAAIADAERAAEDRARAMFEQKLAASGFINPFTHQPITTEAELTAYKTEYDRRRTEEVRSKAGMSDEEMKKFIDSLPEVVAAKETKAQADETLRAARDAEAKAELDRQLAEIGKLDPGIRSFADLQKTETYRELYEKVAKTGCSIVDAFIVTNFERLRAAAAESARQQARNAADGKNHLTRHTSRGQGAAEVPPDVMAQYRVFNPTATEEEIRAHYARNHRKE